MKRIKKHKQDLQAGGLFLTDLSGERSQIMAPADALDWLQTNTGHGSDRAKAEELLILNAKAINLMHPGDRTEVLKAASQAHGQEILGRHFDEVPEHEPAAA